MARIEQLVELVTDAALRAEIAAEVAAVERRQQFGLVFERHIPETALLLNAPVRSGSTVVRRRDADAVPLRVLEVRGDELVVGRAVPPEPAAGRKRKAEEPATETVARSDVLLKRAFDETIYPTLTQVGRVERGGDKPYHAAIQGENDHALELLVFALEGTVDCIYIDPPYNTGATHWKHNNAFVDENDAWRHSRFLAFLERRLAVAKRLLRRDGVLILTIDKHELHHVGMLLETVFPEYEQHLVSIVINPKGTNEDNFARTNEYAVFCVPSKARIGREVIVGRPADIEDDRPDTSLALVANEADEEIEAEEPVEDALADDEHEYWGLIRGGQESSKRPARPGQFYPLFLDEETGEIRDVGAALPTDQDEYPRGRDERGLLIVYPFGADGTTERVWRYEPSRMRQEIETGAVPVKQTAAGKWTFALPRTGGGHIRVRGPRSRADTARDEGELERARRSGAALACARASGSLPWSGADAD